MHIQKQNSQCACGSGSKFKHCCGNKSLTQKNPKRLNQELTSFHKSLIRAASNDFPDQLDAYIDKEQPTMTERDSLSIYQTGLFFWFVCYYVLPRQNLTIFDLVLRVTKKSLSHETLRYLKLWQSLKPSVYHVKKVTERKVELEEMSQRTTFEIDPYNPKDFIKDSLIIGTLAPFSGSRQFLMSMVKIFNNDAESLLEIRERYPYHQNMRHFPHFLAEVLKAEYLHLDWKEDAHKQVVDILIDRMVDTGIDDEYVMNGIKFWHDYTTSQSPQVKNLPAYAAAVEFIVVSNGGYTITQAEVAERYEVNPSTLSQVIKRMK